MNRNIVSSLLESCRLKGYVKQSDETSSLWMLTELGRQASNFFRQSEITHSEREQLEKIYKEFAEINDEFKKLTHDWQMVKIGDSYVPNDHSDPNYDFEVLGRLFDIHQEASRVLRSLTKLIGRYELYRSRLDQAIDRLKSCEFDYFAKPTIDSYHTVWFEFHEDLLKLLGVERVE